MAESGQSLIKSQVISDPEIPTLEAVLDPVTIAKCVQPALPDQGVAIEDIQFNILKHHRGKRCTFEIALQTAKGPHCLVGKVYATDRSDVYRAMDEVRRAGFGPKEEFSIPEPLAYVPELRLLLEEKVEGARAKRIFLTGNEREYVHAAQRCAHWLARFQAIAPRLGPVYRPGDDLVSLLKMKYRRVRDGEPVYRRDDLLPSLEQWLGSLADLDCPFADKATRLCAQLTAAARELSPTELCAGHGEYTCGQILLAEGRTVTVDWDGYDVADPCRDLAKFLVDLKRGGWKNPGSVHALDLAADVFLRTYLSRGRPEVRRNLPFYAAAIYLRLAKKDIDRREPWWAEKSAAMLDEGLRVLAQGF